jgi:hypothetical protein
MSGTVYNLPEWFEDYTTCDSDLKVCGIQSTKQVVDQYLTRLQDDEEEVAEQKSTFLDAMKGLKAAGRYMCQFDTENSITVMCNIVENEFYRLLRAQGRK